MIELVPYNDTYKRAFKAINEAWIKRYFSMEPMDYQLLDDPQGHILDQGGYIAVALLNDEPVGTCALLKMTHGHFDYELAKMGVAPSLQGQGVGLLLGEHIIAKAKALGAKSIFIESNTVLRPAINLYKKLGFKEIERIKTPYNRCNIQMALKV